MTPSAQQHPDSAPASSGSEDDEAAAGATAAPEPAAESGAAKAGPGARPGASAANAAEPESSPGPATAETGPAAAEAEPDDDPDPDPDSQSGPRTGEAGGTPGPAGAPGPDAEAEGTAAPEGTAEPDTEADPGAAAAAKSRLPAFVRTMTATAIDRPHQAAGPVGRPGKAVLAGAAVAGALLVSVPLLMLGGNDDKDNKGPASAGTVLGGNAQEDPGEFAAAAPATRSPDTDSEESGHKKGKPVEEASASATEKSGNGGPKDAGEKNRQKKQDGENKADRGDDQPARAGSGVTLSAPVSLRSHLSGRCLDVPGGDFADGKKLWVWDCNGAAAQKWQFASDGTVRIKGFCLDVANANYNDGTPVQIAWCSGNNAQKFVLNDRHDLVNTVVGKCVDIKDNNAGSGAWLQLWSCAGTDNQKWSV